MKTYREIVRHYEDLIIRGDLAPGATLPTERRLAAQLGVNRSTVSAAFAELRSRGLVQSVQGSGTRVCEDVWGAQIYTPDWHAYAAQGVFHPTRKVVRQIWEANRDPANINLARGELAPDLWPVAELEALFRELSLTIPLGYGDPHGDDELRAAVAEHLQRHCGLIYPPEHILITSGSQQGLHLLTQCLLKPGDAVALEKPSYAYSLPLFTSAGLRPFPLPMDGDGLIPEEIYTLHRQHKVKMIFVSPTLQNPTGATLSLLRRKRLIEICGELRMAIVEDDAHGALTLDNLSPPPPLAALGRDQQQVIYVGTLSKSMAPGLRIGWVVGPKAVIDRLAGAREQMDQGMSVVGQQVAHAILTNGIWEENLARIRVALTRRRDRMAAALRRHLSDALAFAAPTGSYHIWGQWAKPVDDRLLLESAIRRGVVITPGTVYGAAPGFIRLTYASSPESEIEEGILRLRDALFTASNPLR